MIRRFWIGFYAFALVILSVVFLPLTAFLVYGVVTRQTSWLFLSPIIGFAWMLWITWRLLKRKFARAKEPDEITTKSLPPFRPPRDSWITARLRKIPGVDPIRRFIQWFWHIGGLDDVESPLWRTPFGAWFMVFLSSPLLISALVIFIRSEVFLYRGISAEGTVIRLASDHDETVHYAPVFAYTAQDGQTFAVQSNTYSAPPEFRVGQKVPVLYEKDHPEQARIATHEQVHFLEDGFGAIGFFFAGIGFGSLIYQRRRNRRATGSMVAR